MLCENCGKRLPANSKVCILCGQAQREELPKPCPECGAERVKANAGAGSGLLSLSQYGKSFPSRTEVLALVCTACGHTTFYANKPLNLVVKRKDKPIKEQE